MVPIATKITLSFCSSGFTKVVAREIVLPLAAVSVHPTVVLVPEHNMVSVLPSVTPDVRVGRVNTLLAVGVPVRSTI